MVRIPRPDPIEFLIGRKFPEAAQVGHRYAAVVNPLMGGYDHAVAAIDQRNALASALLGISSGRDKAIEEYREILLKKPPEEIERLYEKELDVFKKEMAEANDAADKRRFFNQPAALAPDYPHYFRCAVWSLDAALALSFGRDPERVTINNMTPFAHVSDFARRYVQRWKEIQTAKTAGQLWDPVLPGTFLAWAINNKIEIPDALRDGALNRGLSLKNWQNLYEELSEAQKKHNEDFKSVIAKWQTALEQARAENAKLTAELAKLRSTANRSSETSKQESSAPASSPSGQTKRYNMASALLFGIARSLCGLEIGGMARPDLSKLMRAYDRVGMKVDDETLRNHLLHGSEQAPRLLQARES